MRYELSDYEWSVIRPMLPNKPRGIPAVRPLSARFFWAQSAMFMLSLNIRECPA
jgi:transposase